MLSASCARVRGLIARSFRRGDGVQQGVALLRHLFGHLFGRRQFAGQFFLAAEQFGDMALRVVLAAWSSGPGRR